MAEAGDTNSRVFLVFVVFGCACGIWKSLGQGSNPGHSRDLSRCRDNIRSLTRRCTRERPRQQFLTHPEWPRRKPHPSSSKQALLLPACQGQVLEPGLRNTPPGTDGAMGTAASSAHLSAAAPESGRGDPSGLCRDGILLLRVSFREKTDSCLQFASLFFGGGRIWKVPG